MSLHEHLATGATTTCRAWSVVRRDGAAFGFTDHDRDLVFEGMNFRASSGMTAKALQQATGLSVDNSEASGALSDASVTDEDLAAGRFDGAEVRCWQVNWADPSERVQLFRGSFGEIVRADGAFRAELRGLTEALTRVAGRVFQPGCSAVLGDARCGFDIFQAGYSVECPVEEVLAAGRFRILPNGEFDEGWFDGGRFEVLEGQAAGLVGAVKIDRRDGAGRILELWQEIPAGVGAGDAVRVVAGCNRRAETCRAKFANFLNFRGFPHIPGEDWLTAYPMDGQNHDGGGWTR
ncbi:MAG: DUF2163 domain-containing protein [Paracoccaceae bacterium]